MIPLFSIKVENKDELFSLVHPKQCHDILCDNFMTSLPRMVYLTKPELIELLFDRGIFELAKPMVQTRRPGTKPGPLLQRQLAGEKFYSPRVQPGRPIMPPYRDPRSFSQQERPPRDYTRSCGVAGLPIVIDKKNVEAWENRQVFRGNQYNQRQIVQYPLDAPTTYLVCPYDERPYFYFIGETEYPCCNPYDRTVLNADDQRRPTDYTHQELLDLLRFSGLHDYYTKTKEELIQIATNAGIFRRSTKLR